MIPSGIEAATFRLVVQCLNQLRYQQRAPHYQINGTILENKKVIEYKMCVLIFSTSFVINTSHSKKKWARYDNKRILVFM